MNLTPDFFLPHDPQLHSSLFKYLFKIASRYYSNWGRGVLVLTLDEKLAHHITYQFLKAQSSNLY